VHGHLDKTTRANRYRSAVPFRWGLLGYGTPPCRSAPAGPEAGRPCLSPSPTTGLHCEYCSPFGPKREATGGGGGARFGVDLLDLRRDGAQAAGRFWVRVRSSGSPPMWSASLSAGSAGLQTGGGSSAAAPLGGGRKNATIAWAMRGRLGAGGWRPISGFKLLG